MTRKSKWGFMLNSSSPYKIFLSDLVYGFPLASRQSARFSALHPNVLTLIFLKLPAEEFSSTADNQRNFPAVPEHTCGRGELSEPVDIRIIHL